MTPSPGSIHPHGFGTPQRVIQGFFPGGRPQITQVSPPSMSPVRPPVPAPVQALPASPPSPLVPGRPANGALQPALRGGQPPRPILPTRLRPPALQPAMPLRQQAHQPILPQTVASGAVQLHAGNTFPLPGNFTFKPRNCGQPLPEPVQKKVEAFFKASFADVCVHVGPEAASIGALAFTHGTDLYFVPGQYHPQTALGQRLLDHELTHVLQQRAGRVRNLLGAGIAVVQDPAMEAEAERMGLLLARQPIAGEASLVNSVRNHVAPIVLPATGPFIMGATGQVVPVYSFFQPKVGTGLPACLRFEVPNILGKPSPSGRLALRPSLVQTAEFPDRGRKAKLAANEKMTTSRSPSPQTNVRTRSNSMEIEPKTFFSIPTFEIKKEDEPKFKTPAPVPKTAYVSGRQKPCPADRFGNELFTGKRKSCSWMTGFYEAFKSRNPLPKNGRCERFSENNTCDGDFALDHKSSFYQLVTANACEREVCDGTRHFNAYIYRFKNEKLDGKTESISRNENSVVRVYHLESNLRWLCSKHNGQKAAHDKRDPDDLNEITYAGPCP